MNQSEYLNSYIMPVTIKQIKRSNYVGIAVMLTVVLPP